LSNWGVTPEGAARAGWARSSASASGDIDILNEEFSHKRHGIEDLTKTQRFILSPTCETNWGACMVVDWEGFSHSSQSSRPTTGSVMAGLKLQFDSSSRTLNGSRCRTVGVSQCATYISGLSCILQIWKESRSLLKEVGDDPSGDRLDPNQEGEAANCLDKIDRSHKPAV
jgi:hypothetical protein